jgi:hypothetical protein
VFVIGGTLVLEMSAFRALDVDRAASTVRCRDEHAAPGIDDRSDMVIVHVAGTGPLNQLQKTCCRSWEEVRNPWVAFRLLQLPSLLHP